MAKGSRNPVRERQWRERVAAWAASGATIRDYCRRQGLRETSFHHWRRELRRRDAAASSPPVTAPAPGRPRFVPVTVVPAATAAVEVRCPSGHVVSVPGADVATLRMLFAALAPQAGEGSPC